MTLALVAWTKISLSLGSRPDVVARAEQEVFHAPASPDVPNGTTGATEHVASTAAAEEEKEPEAWSDLMAWFQVHLMNGAPASAVPPDEVAPRIATLRADLPEALTIVNQWAAALNVRREALLENAQNVAAVLQTKAIASQPAHAEAIAELRRLWASMSDGYGEHGIEVEEDFKFYLDEIDRAYLTGEREPALLLYELELVRVFFLRSLYRFSLKDHEFSQLVDLARALAKTAGRTDVVRALSDNRLQPAAVHVQATIAARADEADRLAKGLPAPLPPALQATYDGVERDRADREARDRRIDRERALEGLGATGNPFIDSGVIDLQAVLDRAKKAPPPPPVDWNAEVRKILQGPRGKKP